MTNNSRFIGIEIIWKTLHGVASDDELEELEKWVNEDERHLRYYNNIRQYYEQGSKTNNRYGLNLDVNSN